VPEENSETSRFRGEAVEHDFGLVGELMENQSSRPGLSEGRRPELVIEPGDSRDAIGLPGS